MDDVRHVAAMSDLPMNPRLRLQMLAQGVDGIERLHDPIERIGPIPGIGSGVSRPALEFHVQCFQRPVRCQHAVAGPGVKHQCSVHIIEHAGVQEANLARDIVQHLFRRRADHHQGAVQFGHCGGDPDCCAKCAGSYQIVPTAVPDIRQGVILGDDGHHRFVPSPVGPKCRFHAADRKIDHEPQPAQELHQTGSRLILLKPDLRVLMQLIGQRHETASRIIDRCKCCCLQLIHFDSSRLTYRAERHRLWLPAGFPIICQYYIRMPWRCQRSQLYKSSIRRTLCGPNAESGACHAAILFHYLCYRL